MATALRNASESLMDRIEEELPHSPYWLLIALVMAIVWVVYLAYYNSRVLGLIITAILNKFVKYGHIQFGKQLHFYIFCLCWWLWPSVIFVRIYAFSLAVITTNTILIFRFSKDIYSIDISNYLKILQKLKISIYNIESLSWFLINWSYYRVHPGVILYNLRWLINYYLF